MAETTGISWAHATLNFWIGCTKIGKACDFCYAEDWGKRFGVAWGPKQPRRRTAHILAKIKKLERLAIASGKPFYCFSNSLSDIFDREVPIEWLREAFDAMRLAPHVTFLLLTKRPQLIQKRSEEAGGLPRNCMIGCTIVTQKEADRDLPHLIIAMAALGVRGFVSMEPLLEGVDIRWALGHLLMLAGGLLERGHFSPGLETLRRLSWVITGGESGRRARPTDPASFRSLRDQCAESNTPYHHKQNGEWSTREQMILAHGYAEAGPEEFSTFDAIPGIEFERWGKKASGRLLDGVIHDAMPR